MLDLEQVILEVTQACNHACVHCYNYWFAERAPVNAAGALSRREILPLIRAIRQASRLKGVALSGGEPLLRPDLPDLATDLVDEGLRVTVITNSRLLTERRVNAFPRELLFELTLFSAEAAVHDRIAGRPGAFQRVIEAAVAVRKRQAGLALSCVVSRLNLAGLEQTLELAVALGPDGIALNRVNLAAHTLPVADQLVPSTEELRQALDTAERVACRAATTFAVSVPVPPCLVDPAPYPHLHFGWCPRGGADAYYTIGYNGLVRPCNHSSVVLGDVRRQSFRAIVKGPKTRAFWRATPTVCRTCAHPLRDRCRGGCPAASHECFGTATRLDPFVEWARRQTGTCFAAGRSAGGARLPAN